MRNYFSTWLFFVFYFGLSIALYAGITGSISGYVIDQETGNPLPGAAIEVEETTVGAMADKNGFFMIHNLPAGTYDVSANMIGYIRSTIQNVKINVDLVTELTFELSTEILQFDEIVITKQRDLIQKDITSSTYFITEEDINDKLPIDSYREAISLLPGVVGNHIRGGRENDALYLLDGLPIQGSLSREISSAFPNSSIVEMMVQTGGFSAEYGQAGSGVINIVSKEGKNEVEGGLHIYSDFFDTGIFGNDNSRRLEMNVGGPLTIGLGGPVINSNYFISADLNLSDTHWREQMRSAFDAPIFENYNINSKLSIDVTGNTKLALQGLVSNWNWRKFDPQWRKNLQGLAEHQHNSYRISANLTHSFSPKLFTSLRLATYWYNKHVLGSVDEESANLVFEDPTNADSPILQGIQPWQEATKEKMQILKFDLVGKISTNHLLKTGFEVQDYELTSQSQRLTAIPLPASIGFNRVDDGFEYFPKFYSLYAQDSFEWKRASLNMGVRYDHFRPRVIVKDISSEFDEIRAVVKGLPTSKESTNYTTISPRIGVSVPLSDKESFLLNYGWFYQMPPLFYLYSNAEQRVNGPLPILGNVDLEPIRTIASELSYKRVFSNDILLTITAFSKKFTNLIDTQTFILPDSLIGPETTRLGFSRYTNSAFGRARGLEISAQKKLTNRLSGRVSYTFMKAQGTSSSAEDEFKAAISGGKNGDNEIAKVEYPLSWDQRHSIVMNGDYQNEKWHVNVLLRLFSPLPFTEPGSVVINNARSSWRKFLDMKIIRKTKVLNGRLRYYFEVRNLLNENDLINGFDEQGVNAYKLFDPFSMDLGRRLRLGMTIDF